MSMFVAMAAQLVDKVVTAIERASADSVHVELIW